MTGMVNLTFWIMWSVAVAGVMWWGISGERAFRHRIAIISKRLPPHNWRAMIEEYRAVPREQHVWYLMTFRDWRKLYGPETWKAMGWRP